MFRLQQYTVSRNYVTVTVRRNPSYSQYDYTVYLIHSIALRITGKVVYIEVFSGGLYQLKYVHGLHPKRYLPYALSGIIRRNLSGKYSTIMGMHNINKPYTEINLKQNITIGMYSMISLIHTQVLEENQLHATIDSISGSACFIFV